MVMIYTSASAHVNTHPYDLITPVYYNGGQPIEYLTGEVAPIYNPIYSDAQVRSRWPIKNMIDMFITKTPFIIVHDRDVVAIFHTLDNYLLEVQDSVKLNITEVVEYVKKILSFRVVMYDRFRKVLNKNPEWKKAYWSGEDGVKLVFELLNKIFGLEGPDPIEGLRKPPYTLTSIVTPPATAFGSPTQPGHSPTNPTGSGQGIQFVCA